MTFLFGFLDVLDLANTACRQYPFEFVKVRLGQRLVHSQLVDRDVILMLFEKRAGLGSEALESNGRGKQRKVNRYLVTHLVFEVRVYGSALPFVDELYQAAQALAGILQ